MAASRQSGPLNVGPNSPVGQPSAVGTIVLVQEYTLDVTDVTPGTGEDAFRAPLNSALVGMDVVVETASDAGTTGTLALANSDGDIVTGFDVTATGLLSLQGGDAAVASVSRFLAPASGEDTNLQLVYAETGDAATEGVFHVRLMYVQGNASQS